MSRVIFRARQLAGTEVGREVDQLQRHAKAGRGARPPRPRRPRRGRDAGPAGVPEIRSSVQRSVGRVVTSVLGCIVHLAEEERRPRPSRGRIASSVGASTGSLIVKTRAEGPPGG